MAEPNGVLGVVYDEGAGSPGEIVRAAADVAPIAFVCDFAIERVANLRPTLEALGVVVDITGADDYGAARFLRAAGVDGLVTFSESQLRTTARLAAVLGLDHHSLETIERCCDKSAQRRAFEAAGIDHVRHVKISRIDDLEAALAVVGLPCVAKPVIGVGSRDTQRLDDAASAHAWLAPLLTGADASDQRQPAMILESLLVGDPAKAGPDWGDYVSVEAMVAGEHIRPLSVTGKFPLVEPFRESGIVVPHTMPAELESETIELATAAVRALGIRHGVTHTECKLTADGPRLIEVNARVGGYVPELLLRSTGFDLLRAAMLLARGRDVETPELTYSSVEFQLMLQPPISAKRLVSLPNLRELRRVPGIHRVQRVVADGGDVDWRAGTSGSVLKVVAGAATHDDARALAKTVHEIVRPEYAA